MITISETKHQPAERACAELTRADLTIIRQVYFAFVRFRMPFLPDQKWMKRAKILASRGYLKVVAGVDAYNAEMSKAQS